MRRDQKLYNLERKYIGKKVYFYLCDLPKRSDSKMPKYGPYEGTVVAITNNLAYAEETGAKTYTHTDESIISAPKLSIEDQFVYLKDIYLKN